jgi:homoserine O-acetyltransferase
MQAAAPEGENRDETFVRGAVGRLDVGIGYIYQWEASHDYNPSAGLERIEATLLAINAADDERNPPETGVTDAAMKRVKNGKLYLIPASTETRGHLTTGDAKFYKQQLQELLQTAPQRTM